MKNYGFLIDQSKCIGCHACSTACKSENQVPVGVHRTYVKYVDVGRFPQARRAFQVTRCNHCANPPCVHICPTRAMYQRVLLAHAGSVRAQAGLRWLDGRRADAMKEGGPR